MTLKKAGSEGMEMGLSCVMWKFTAESLGGVLSEKEVKWQVMAQDRRDDHQRWGS